MTEARNDFIQTPKKEGFTVYNRLDKTPMNDRIQTPLGLKCIHSVKKQEALFPFPAIGTSAIKAEGGYMSLPYTLVSPNYQNCIHMDVPSFLPHQTQLDEGNNLQLMSSPLLKMPQKTTHPIQVLQSSYAYKFNVFSSIEKNEDIMKNDRISQQSSLSPSSSYCEQNMLTKMACETIADYLRQDDSQVVGSHIILKRPKFIIELSKEEETQKLRDDPTLKRLENKLNFSSSEFLYQIPENPYFQRKIHPVGKQHALFLQSQEDLLRIPHRREREITVSKRGSRHMPLVENYPRYFSAHSRAFHPHQIKPMSYYPELCNEYRMPLEQPRKVGLSPKQRKMSFQDKVEEKKTVTTATLLNDEETQRLKQELQIIHEKSDSSFVQQQMDELLQEKDNQKQQRQSHEQVNDLDEVQKEEIDMEGENNDNKPQCISGLQKNIADVFEEKRTGKQQYHELSTAKKVGKGSSLTNFVVESGCKKRRHFDTPSVKRGEFSTPSTKKKTYLQTSKSKSKPFSGVVLQETLKIKSDDHVHTKNIENNADISESVESEDGENHSELKKECCGCKKTKCLKLYCECFQTQRYCQDCSCQDCQNRPEFEENRKQAMESIQQRNSSAFDSKLDNQGEEVFESASGQKIHSKGCNCKRSDCRKKYCECFQMGARCTHLCKCFNCKNQIDSHSPSYNGSKQSMSLHPLFYVEGNSLELNAHNLNNQNVMGTQFRNGQQSGMYYYPPQRFPRVYDQWAHYYPDIYQEYPYPPQPLRKKQSFPKVDTLAADLPTFHSSKKSNIAKMANVALPQAQEITYTKDIKQHHS